MPDITKCANKICPMRFNCWRQIAQDSIWQSYAEFDFEYDENNFARCEFFLPDRERQISRESGQTAEISEPLSVNN